MVTKAILKMLEIASIEEYFEFIINVKENGHDAQARGLFNALSTDNIGGGAGQRTKFFNWYAEQLGEPETLTEISNFKNYFL
jgi:hypothetical protein